MDWRREGWVDGAVGIEGKQRVNLLLEEERFIVIVELRDKYNLLITAFYIDYEHTMKKKLKKYRDSLATSGVTR